MSVHVTHGASTDNPIATPKVPSLVVIMGVKLTWRSPKSNTHQDSRVLSSKRDSKQAIDPRNLSEGQKRKPSAFVFATKARLLFCTEDHSSSRVAQRMTAA